MTTSIKDHQLDDHLFEKLDNHQTNGRTIFRPWDCAMNETTKSTIKAHLKEQELKLNLNSKSIPRLPNDLLTEMFSASCTMNQTSLTAMETIYSQLYRDYFASSKSLAIKMENGSRSISGNDLSFFGTLTGGKMNLSKFVNDCTAANNLPSDLLSNGTLSNGNLSNSLLTANGLITDHLIANSRTPNRPSVQTSLASKNLLQQPTAVKLSTTSANESTLANQLPVNTTTTQQCKSTDATTNRFLTPLLNDKNQTKKSRPKRFRCTHCNTAFSNNGQLKGHIRTHTGKNLIII